MEPSSFTQKAPLLKQTAFIQQRKWIFQPQGQLPLSNLNSTLRINIQGTKQGFMCPYSSYLRVVVGIPPTTTLGCLTLDHPDALIQTFRITCRGKQLQRTIQCNRLMGILHSMGTIAARRNFVGSTSWGTCYQPLNTYTANGVVPIRANLAGVGQPVGTFQTYITGGSSGYLPTQAPLPVYNGASGWNPQQGVIMQQKGSISHIDSFNPVFPAASFQAAADVSWLQAYLSVFGSAKNLRAQYLFVNQCCDRLQTTSSKNVNVIGVNTTNTMSKTSYPNKIGSTYQLTVPDAIGYDAVDPQNSYTTIPNSVTITNQVSRTGYSNFTSPYFWKSDPAICLSNAVGSVSFANGQFLTQRQPQQIAEIKVAIPSNQFGILIPQQQYRRIPLNMLNQCAFQITFCPSAFYSSGYCDGSQYDDLGMAIQVQRTYVVLDVSLVLDWYVYKNNLIYQNQLLNTNIFMQTYHYQPLLIQVFPNGTALSNVFLVTAPAGVINQLIIKIYSNDYNQYNFCRRNYGLSANVTSLQVRHNGIYYPDAPFVGNGGNPCMISTDNLSNSVYLQNLQQSHLFRPQTCKINPYNFAVNQRVYDVTNTATLYNQAQSFQVPVNTTSQFTQPINMDTALGQSFLHEKRCCGQAIYVIPFNSQVMQGDVRVISGLNTTFNNNLQVMMQTNKTNNYNRPVVIYIWAAYSKIVVPQIDNQRRTFVIKN